MLWSKFFIPNFSLQLPSAVLKARMPCVKKKQNIIHSYACSIHYKYIHVNDGSRVTHTYGFTIVTVCYNGNPLLR